MNDIDKKLFSQNLLKLMIEKDFSQATLARCSGVSEATIHYYLAGQRTPKLTTAERLAKALKVDLSTLLEPQKLKYPKIPISHLKYELFGTTEVSDEMLDVVRAFAKMIYKEKKE